MRWLATLLVLSLAAPALAEVVIPPKPSTYKGDKWAWERAVRRCADRPTQWSRERCIRGLYDN
jgi:hypothetical protein